jgi:serpin B
MAAFDGLGRPRGRAGLLARALHLARLKEKETAMTRSKRRTLLVALAVGGVLVACGSGSLEPGRLVRSSLPRITNPQVSAPDRASQTTGNTAFAFDCYRRLAAQEGNVFYSPLSVSLALAMTWAGARTSTEEQMAAALQFKLTQDRLHPYFNALDLELNSRGQGSKGKDGGEFRLRVLNAIWGQEGYEFLAPFLDVLAQHYGAGLRLLDFGKPEEAADAINKWIAQQTEDRIPELLSPDMFQGPVALVLTNAVYFNAAWEHQFKRSETLDGSFRLRSGQTVSVPMMHQTASFRMGSGSLFRCGTARCPGWGYRAIELPYDGGELAMLIIVPDVLDNFEAKLAPGVLATILDSLTEQSVELQMPRWTFRSPVLSLTEPLTALGMKDAFVVGQADFSGMDGRRDLFVSEVAHQAFVAADEAGTEAAAATSVNMELGAAPAAPVSFVVDQPFLYLIRDIPTGAILFVGRTVDPR